MNCQQRALSFLNNDGNLRHNNVNSSSVYVAMDSGEWKLGNFEFMTPVDAPYAKLNVAGVHTPPEARENEKPRTKW